MERQRRPSSLAKWRRLDAALAALAIALAVVALGAGMPGAPPAPSAVETAHLTGSLVVADLRGHALTIIQLPAADRRSIPLEGGPHELLPLPDGRLAVSLEQAGRIALVDWHRANVAYLETGGLPHGLALDGTSLLVTDRAAEAVRRFDLGSWRELEPARAARLPHQVVAPGGALFVADASSDRLALGDGRSVPQPAVAESLAASPDGTQLVVAGAGDGRLLLYDRGRDATLDLNLGGRPVRVAFAPSGATVAVALSAAGAVALVDLDGTVRRIDVGGVPDGLAFSADGRVLFVSDMAGGTVTAVELRTDRVLARLDGGATAGALIFLE